jgi:hypothetical protein
LLTPDLQVVRGAQKDKVAVTQFFERAPHRQIEREHIHDPGYPLAGGVLAAGLQAAIAHWPVAKLLR